LRFFRYASEKILGGGSLSNEETPVARLEVVVLERGDDEYWKTVDVFRAAISEPSFKALALSRGGVDADVPLNKSCAKLAPAASL